MPREHLPNRRDADVYDFEHGGIRYRAIVGLYDDGRPGEVFLNANVKVGSGVEAIAKDTAVLISLDLQHGAPLAITQRAMTRLEDGSAATPGGKVLDLILAAQQTACA